MGSRTKRRDRSREARRWISLGLAASVTLGSHGCEPTPESNTPTSSPHAAATRPAKTELLGFDRERKLEFFKAPVIELEQGKDGTWYATFGPMARWFTIDSRRSPDATQLVAAARSSRESGDAVYVTISDQWAEPADKRAGKGGPWIVVRIAAKPDPRAPR